MNSLLGQLCSCELVLDAQSAELQDLPTKKARRFRKDKLSQHRQDAVYAVLSELGTPVHPHDALYGRLRNHLRCILGSELWATRLLDAGTGLDRAAFDQMKRAFRSQLGEFEAHRLDKLVYDIAETVPSLRKIQWDLFFRDSEYVSGRRGTQRCAQVDTTSSGLPFQEAAHPPSAAVTSAQQRSDRDESLNPDSTAAAPNESPAQAGTVAGSGSIAAGSAAADRVDQIEVPPAPLVANLVRVIEGLRSRSLRQLRTVIDGLRERSAAGIDLETDRKPSGDDL